MSTCSNCTIQLTRFFLRFNSLKGLIHKNLQNVPKGGMEPRPMVSTIQNIILWPWVLDGPSVSTWYALSLQLLYPPRPLIWGFCRFLLTTPFKTLSIFNLTKSCRDIFFQTFWSSEEYLKGSLWTCFSWIYGKSHLTVWIFSLRWKLIAISL